MSLLFLLVVFYLGLDVADRIHLVWPQVSATHVPMWILQELIVAFVYGGFIGSMAAFLRGQSAPTAGLFFNNARRYYLRFLGADFLLLLIVLPVGIAFSLFPAYRGNPGKTQQVQSLIGIFVSVIRLYWYSTIAVSDCGIWRAFKRGIRTLTAGPIPFAIALVYGMVRFICTKLSDSLPGLDSAAILGLVLNAVIAAPAAIGCYVCAVTICRKARVNIFGDSSENSPPDEPASVPLYEQRANTSLRLAFLSFLPPFSIFSLALGILALKGLKRFDFRAATACVAGGFFTAFYLILLAGHFAPHHDVNKINYSFLTETDPDLGPCVELLEKGAFLDAGKKLDMVRTGQDAKSAAFLCADAIVKANTGENIAGAASFAKCIEMKPAAAQYYYLYGRQLLRDGSPVEAARNFEAATKINPGMSEAKRFLELVNNIRKPSRVTDVIGFIAILLMLFTFHEYAHAYAAWRLGDSTAKDNGRLTLNPIAHLDLIGSIILPGILLWRESSMLFGWAKPVPVDRTKFADPRRADIIVSFAGPGANLVIAMVVFLLIAVSALAMRLIWPEAITLDLAAPSSSISFSGVPHADFFVILFSFLKSLFYTSLILGFFNLLPIPPLDGSWILGALIPASAGRWFAKLRSFGMIIFLVLIFTPVLGYIMLLPILPAWGLLHLCFAAIGFA
jgi:Zn-dependent protease